MTAVGETPAISILVPDLRSPTVGAAIRLRELLAPLAVEIVGPDFGGGVCSLYRAAGPFVTVPSRRLYRLPEFWWESRAIDRAIRGRVVVAVKAYMNTVPVALRLQAQGRARAVVFLDEWDGAVLEPLSRGERAARLLRHWWHPLEDVYYPRVERRIREASAVWSTTTALQRRFGGEVIAMGVDTDRFQPQPPAETAALRASLGLTNCRVIGFGGVVRPHKGVEQILDALALLGRRDVKLLVIGPVTEHLASLLAQERYRPFLAVAGAPMHDPKGINAEISRRMPAYLDVADLVVLPLVDNALAQSQMPIKVFEAMAMAKPIIASALADLPRVLEHCGWTVPPGDGPALAAAIAHALDRDGDARAMGERARARCLAHYSRAVCATRMRALVAPLLEGR